ncbi:Atxe2 family lasso peptide isopeptidase [Steroidobacter sp.]|uniref:Atxe2 family lasso peptide isopeptidase n=1 Tax=Steroidobacter sp. TaxID=1978227 RepID=UPI001A4E921C|nr:Atxe2 family lasso peptide isopeptidase [Steroidobacter sp.]MBL8268736.1 Atxe2 family lasso peptide isopeptidase [Steroidobacter sp.]
MKIQWSLVCGVLLTALTLDAASATSSQGLSAEQPRVSSADLVELRALGGTLGVSPSGKSVAFQLQQADFAARTYRSSWHVVAIAGGPPIRVGEGGDVILDRSDEGALMGGRVAPTVQWSPDERWIAYLRKDAGTVQLWRSSADGVTQQQLTHGSADVMEFEWSANGESLYFETGREHEAMLAAEQEEGDRGYLLDDRFMPDASRKPLWPICKREQAPAQSGSRQCSTTLRVLELASGQERGATSDEQEGYSLRKRPAAVAGLDSTRQVQKVIRNLAGSRSAWLENENPREFPGLHPPLTLYVDGKRCDAPACHGRLNDVWWRDDQIVFRRREGHANRFSVFYVWAPDKRGAPRQVYRTEDQLDACKLAQGRLVCLYESPTLPNRLVSIDLERGKLRTVLDPNPDFARFDLGKVELLEWHDAFGNPTFGHLVLPPDYQPGRRYPLVIVQYRSRGFLNGGVGDEYPIYPLAAAGMAVLSFDCPTDANFNMRNDPKNLGAWIEASLRDGHERRMDLSALDIVIDQLDQRGIIDPRRVGVTGLSHGADNVEFMLFNSTRFAAAAVSGAWSRPQYFYLNPNTWYRNEMIKYALGAQNAEQVSERGRVASIVYNTDKVTTPLLIQAPDAELLATLPIHIALLDAGKPVETYVFPDEYHIKWQPQHKRAIAERSIDWFRFWLLNSEDASPDKAEQYSRWRKLRGPA